MQLRTLGRRRLAGVVAAITLTALAGCGGQAHTTTTDQTGASGRSNAATTPASSAFAAPPAAKGPVDSVTWATRAEPSSLDSAVAFGGDTNAVLSNVCESLVQLQADGSITPLLASKVDQPDDKTYVFTLRQGVTFFDGSPLTPADVVFSLKRTIDPKTGSFFGAYGKHVTSVEATGADQVTVKLSQTDPIFYQMLATPLGQVVEKAYVEKAGAKYGSAASLPMCTGPYQVSSWQQGQSISLKANDRWWNGKDQLARAAKFVFVADDATLTAGLTSGEIDGTYVAASASIPALKKSAKLNFYSGPSATFHSLIVAHTGGIMGNPAVREAVRQTIDYTGTVKSLFNGFAEPMRALAPSGSWGSQAAIYQKAYNQLPAAQQDLDGARKTLKDAGAANPTITLAVPGYLPDFRAFAESFQSTAKQVGITVDLKLLPKADFFALFSDAKARAKVDLFYSDWVGWVPDPTELYTAIGLPGGAANFGGYDNPEVTKILNQAYTTVDPAKRADLVVQAQALIMKDLPWIPFAAQYQTLPLNKRLAGTTVASPLWTYTSWLVKTGSAN